MGKKKKKKGQNSVRQYLTGLEGKEQKVARGTAESQLICKTNCCATVEPFTPLPTLLKKKILTAKTELDFILQWSKERQRHRASNKYHLT